LETKYQPVGKCIYCGTSDKQLTDEHTIAFGLNGAFVLPKASCDDCAKITGRTEGQVLRGFALDARTALGFQTRRPKNVPKTFRLGVIRGGQEEIIDVPIGDHAVVLPLPLYPEPAYFQEQKGDHSYGGGIGLSGIVTVWVSDREQVRKKFNADEIFIEQIVDHISFAKMLAKIGFCQAVAQFGRDAMEEGYVLPAILGARDDIGKWVGSSGHVLSPAPGVGHQIYAEKLHRPGPMREETLIVAYIRLFSRVASPMYLVIVGGTKGAVRVN